ncbi:MULTISPECIES: DUF3307 domain-containing protein [unclassified Hyphomicrobium]|uniref:DUF3307 domain-containing protein n=1 Tax=unclassified Hyphomicrobium TaxID=2619925 RepID=UPI000213EF61|nr:MULTISPECIES: DUF3307 domain-containing protein [unclassified Hyphomicrobium]CCB64807.1 conserved protein of unknown function [Hyphomicrobium sp. MC1]
MSPGHAALAAITYLLVKHAVADFILQSDGIFRQKGHYGAPGGLLHAFIHIVLTAPVFWLFPGGGLPLAAALLAGEFLLHYHIDWLKQRLVAREGWTPKDTGFWWALGIDQLLHGLTYIAILWLWLPAN